MRGSSYAISLLIVAFALIGAGGSVLIWLAPVSAEQMTPAQNDLRELADTVVKAGLGVLAGFFGARPFQSGNGGANRDS